MLCRECYEPLAEPPDEKQDLTLAERDGYCQCCSTAQLIAEIDWKRQMQQVKRIPRQ